jgi:hypothetical protein
MNRKLDEHEFTCSRVMNAGVPLGLWQGRNLGSKKKKKDGFLADHFGLSPAPLCQPLAKGRFVRCGSPLPCHPLISWPLVSYQIEMGDQHFVGKPAQLRQPRGSGGKANVAQ